MQCQQAVEYLYNLKTKATEEEANAVALGHACIEAGKTAKKDVEKLEKEVEFSTSKECHDEGKWNAEQAEANADDQDNELDRLRPLSASLQVEASNNWVLSMENWEEKITEDGEKQWIHLKTKELRWAKPKEVRVAEQTDLKMRETLKQVSQQENVLEAAKAHKTEANLAYVNALKDAKEADALTKDEMQELEVILSKLAAEEAEEKAKQEIAAMEEAKRLADEAEKQASEMARQSKHLSVEAAAWETRYDKYGRAYFYNTKTDESRWDEPEVIKQAEEAKLKALEIEEAAQREQEKAKAASAAAEEAKRKKRELEVAAIANLSAFDARRRWTLAKEDVKKYKALIEKLTEEVAIARGKADRLHKIENEARIVVEAARRDGQDWKLIIDEKSGRSYYWNTKTKKSIYDTPEVMKVLNKKEIDYENKQQDCKEAEDQASELERQLKDAEETLRRINFHVQPDNEGCNRCGTT